MASDSRVSGTDDARRTDDAADGAPDRKVNPEQADATKDRPAARADKQPAKESPRPDGAAKEPAAGNGTDRKRAGKKRATKTTAEGKPAAAKANGKPEVREASPKAAAAATVPPSAKAQEGAERRAEKPTADPKSAEKETSTEPESETHESWFGGVTGNRFLLLNAVPSWVVSMVAHAALLTILALLTLPERPPDQRIVAVANQNDVEEVENLEQEDIDPLDVEKFEGAAPAEVLDAHTTTADYDVPALDDVSAAPEQMKLEDFGEMSALPDALLDQVGGGTGTGLGEVRGAKARRAALDRWGGSAGSEAAVAAALKWLAEHQMQDGGWDFDHTKGPCRGRCSHPGMIPPARNGATAMALLPFLGAGQTHKEGKYKETVEKGLAYLIRNMKLSNNMGDLSDAGGRLYSHGLASIALCEAYAMTNDPGLLRPAQLSLNFIVYAQDPIGGGWRYKPRQAGDTSVLGWQLMACKSGHMAYLKVSPRTILGASKFLDTVQSQEGARYGYTVPAEGPATTAVGLLCRMYLGWKKDNPALRAGVEYLHERGPTDNIYYNYYATQVMRHYGGTYWEAWNARMRDRLVDSQDTKGHEAGSWYITRSPHSDRGGRLYCTSMATMILEVYYRHMPIYGKQAAEEEFPL